MKKNKKAFSLIELLIVITIIGILSVLFLPSITTGPSKARDTARVTNIADIALALEVYYQDVGHFPNSTGEALIDTSTAGAAIVDYFDNSSVPTDPQTGNPNPVGITGTGSYYYEGTDNGYVLIANLENGKVSEGYCEMPSASVVEPGFDCTLLNETSYKTADAAYVLTKG